ncbi:MAG TPA: glycosyltransferase family 2 protein [Acidimicrobiales bacterium]|nr:glycosyltransferase family 2 protein [Acidimicrobiales bacterium]
MSRKKISIISCAYNEEDCIDELARRLARVFDSLPNYDFEAILVENGSSDQTLERMLGVVARDPRFSVVELSRNFGFDGGLFAGLPHVTGDAVVFMAADLQDPPEVIPAFVEKWEQGYENVYGLVSSRKGTDWRRRLNSKLFYFLIERLAEHPIPPNARDFRLIDRRICLQLLAMDEKIWFLRGLIAWTGFRSIGVEFDQASRFGGESKAATFQIVEFAIKAIFAHSLAPLRFIPLLGLALISGSFLALIGIGVNSLVNGVPFPGFGTIVALLLFLFGVLFCLMSVIGIYIGLIFEQVRQRPAFVVRDVHSGMEEGNS